MIPGVLSLPILGHLCKGNCCPERELNKMTFKTPSKNLPLQEGGEMGISGALLWRTAEQGRNPGTLLEGGSSTLPLP